MYDQGLGVGLDEKTAYNWFRKAAKQGYVKAQYATAIHLTKGLGVAKDYVRAYAWMTLANQSKNLNIKKILHKIGRKLTDVQIIEAETLANRWQSDQDKLTKGHLY